MLLETQAATQIEVPVKQWLYEQPNIGSFYELAEILSYRTIRYTSTQEVNAKVDFFLLTKDNLTQDEIDYLAYVQSEKCCLEDHDTYGLQYFIDNDKLIAYRYVWESSINSLMYITDLINFEVSNTISKSGYLKRFMDDSY